MTKDEVMAEVVVNGKTYQLLFVGGRRFSIAINGRNERWFLTQTDAKAAFETMTGKANG